MLPDINPSFSDKGAILYSPHPCQTPEPELTVGTIWQCGRCSDHWELQVIGENPHWVRIRRVKYEASSK